MTIAPCTRRPVVCLPSARRRPAARGRPMWLAPVAHPSSRGDDGRELHSPGGSDDAPEPR